MKQKSRHFHFVFTFTNDDCCDKPHLWAQSIEGLDRSDALRRALKLVRENGNHVYEVIQVGEPLGVVCEVEEE